MLSVTLLSDYLYCQRKLYLQRVLGFAEIPKESLVLGSIRHQAYDLINKTEESIVKSINKNAELDFLLQKYRREHSKILCKILHKNKKNLKQFNLDVADILKRIWPLILEESETRANNIFNFIKLHEVYGEELWDNLFPKIQSEFRIESDNLRLKGIIDQIEVYENGFVPIEIKTGKCPKEGVWPGHKIQIGAYALLLEDFYKVPIKEGFVNYVESKEKRHIAINPFLKEEIIDIRDKVASLLVNEEIPDFCSNDNKCGLCGLKEQCRNQVMLEKRLKVPN